MTASSGRSFGAAPADSPSGPKDAGKAVRDSTTCAARARLATLLKYPDDLSGKLDSLRTKFVAEKAAVDAQLKAGTQGQLDDCELGLENLVHVRQNLTEVRSHFRRIVNSGDNSLAAIPPFPRIQKISLIHQNFVKTASVIRRFQALNDRVEHLTRILQEHLADPLGPAPDLLLLHCECYTLEKFRVRTLEQVASASRDVQTSLQTYFRRLDTLLEAFRDYITQLSKNLLALVEANQTSVIVRLAKIIVLEEQTNRSSGTTATTNPATATTTTSAPASNSNQKDSASTSTSSGPQASARAAFLAAVHESITKKFSILYESHKDDPGELLQHTLESVVIADLTIVFDRIVCLFPKTYKLFPFFVLEYHRHVCDLVNRIIADKLDTGIILLLLRWSRDYYAEMNSKLGLSEELLEPKLLENHEQQLVTEYIRLVTAKLDEWIKNLLVNESRDFIERSKPLECDAQNAYVLSAAIILFNMVNQQIDVALDASRGLLLLEVVRACARTLITFQNSFSTLVTSEYSKFVSDKNNISLNMIEYTIALANDSLKCTEFLEVIIKRLEFEADHNVLERITTELNGALEGFMKLSRTCTSIIIDVTVADLKSLFAKLFTINSWYQEEVMQDIIATLGDYYNDYKSVMSEYVFGKLISDLMDKILWMWLESLRAKSSKFKVPSCWTRMESDLKLIIDFFSQYKSAKRVEKHFLIMDKLFTIICSNKKMIFLDFYALWKLYNDVPISVIEDLLYKRDDLEKSTVKEIMESIRQKTKDDAPPPESKKSIFSTMQPSNSK